MAGRGVLPQIIVDTGKSPIGDQRFMATRAEFTYATGLVRGTTRTFTTRAVDGFDGSVMVILADAKQVAVPGGMSRLYRYHVDGRQIGRTDRTDAWPASDDPLSLLPADTRSVVSVNIFHSWDPDNFQQILEKWREAGAPVSQLVTEARSVAHAFTGRGRGRGPWPWLPGPHWSRERWAALVTSALALASLALLAFFSLLDARSMPKETMQTCPGGATKTSQLGIPGAGAGNLTATLREGQRQEVDFGRSVSARTLFIYLDLSSQATGPPYFAVHTDPFVRDDDAVLVDSQIMTHAQSDGKTLILTVCFIREKQHSSLGDPGVYTGSVTIDDSRLKSAVTVPITVTLQYIHGILLLWLYLLVLIPGTWCLWVIKTSREGDNPFLDRSIWHWFKTVNGVVSVVAGGVAAFGVYVATYLRDPTWGSSALQPLALYGAMFSAFVTTAGLAQLAGKKT